MWSLWATHSRPLYRRTLKRLFEDGPFSATLPKILNLVIFVFSVEVSLPPCSRTGRPGQLQLGKRARLCPHSKGREAPPFLFPTPPEKKRKKNKNKRLFPHIPTAHLKTARENFPRRRRHPSRNGDKKIETDDGIRPQWKADDEKELKKRAEDVRESRAGYGTCNKKNMKKNRRKEKRN